MSESAQSPSRTSLDACPLSEAPAATDKRYTRPAARSRPRGLSLPWRRLGPASVYR